MNVTTDIKYLLDHAAKGDRQAQYLAGCRMMLDGGSDVLSQAYLRQAAEGGFAPAQRLLGILGLCGRLLTPESAFQNEVYYADRAPGVTWLHTAAENGDAVAAYLYGKCVQMGVGIPQQEGRGERSLRALGGGMTEYQTIATMMLLDHIGAGASTAGTTVLRQTAKLAS